MRLTRTAYNVDLFSCIYLLLFNQINCQMQFEEKSSAECTIKKYIIMVKLINTSHSYLKHNKCKKKNT